MTTGQVVGLIVQGILALGGLAGLASLLTVRAQKRSLVAQSGKTDAEADAVLQDAYSKRASTQVSLLDPYEQVMRTMREELAERDARIDRMAATIERLTAYNDVLRDALRHAGLSVPPMPPAGDAERAPRH